MSILCEVCNDTGTTEGEACVVEWFGHLPSGRITGVRRVCRAIAVMPCIACRTNHTYTDTRLVRR